MTTERIEMNEAKQAYEDELEKLRKKMLDRAQYVRMVKLVKMIASLVFQVAAYVILLGVDRRICLAVFLIQWAIQLTIPRKIK